MITGPDVSSNNAHPIDWQAVKRAGHTFAFVKATEGATYTNPYFAPDSAGARAAGLVVGAYHWVSPSDPVAQARRAATVIKAVRQPGDLPVALDFEQQGVTHAVLCSVRRELHALGLPTLTYTYPNFWTLHGDPRCADCGADPLWFAAYQEREPVAPAPWRSLTFWQHDDKASVPGISGGASTDMSIFMGTPAQFAALRGTNPSEEDTVTPDDIEKIADRVVAKLGIPGGFTLYGALIRLGAWLAGHGDNALFNRQTTGGPAPKENP